MKILKVLRANKKWISKWFFVITISAAVFCFLHILATMERGYNAIGGEASAILIPLFVWVVSSFKED
jgi:presenilin-like A22 family membrane protease